MKGTQEYRKDIKRRKTAGRLFGPNIGRKWPSSENKALVKKPTENERERERESGSLIRSEIKREASSTNTGN